MTQIFTAVQQIKTAAIAMLVVYLLIASLMVALPSQAQERLSSQELTRIVQKQEGLQLDRRVIILETISAQDTIRLNSIEGMLWKMLIGIACLMGETVWGYVIRARVGGPS